MSAKSTSVLAPSALMTRIASDCALNTDKYLYLDDLCPTWAADREESDHPIQKLLDDYELCEEREPDETDNDSLLMWIAQLEHYERQLSERLPSLLEEYAGALHTAQTEHPEKFVCSVMDTSNIDHYSNPLCLLAVEYLDQDTYDPTPFINHNLWITAYITGERVCPRLVWVIGSALNTSLKIQLTRKMLDEIVQAHNTEDDWATYPLRR